jgi:plasmid stability protein
MRTTINLPDDLLRDTKQLAASTGRTLTRVVEDALRAALARRERPADRPAVHVPTAPGRPAPGVDIDDTAALLDLMEPGEDRPAG